MSRMEEGVIKVVPTQMAHSFVHAHLTSHWHWMADHVFHMQSVGEDIGWKGMEHVKVNNQLMYMALCIFIFTYFN